MRLTFSTDYRNLLADLTRNKEALAGYEQQVSSGKRIHAPGDDPLAAASSVDAHGRLGALDSYARSTDSTTSRLTITDSLLSDMISQLTSAKTTALGVRSSVATAGQRDAAARALQAVKENLVADLSTAYQGTYIFSGAKITTVPFTIANGTVSAYQGDTGSLTVDVDTHIAVPVTYNGNSITRGADTQDVFAGIDGLITALQNGDGAGIDAGVAALDRAYIRTTQVQTAVGTSLNRLQGQSSRLATVKQTVQSQISSLEDADLAEAITGLQRSQTAQDATLRAIAIINQQNLMDYLK